MDLHGAALGALGGALLAWLARRDGGTQLAAAILLPVGHGYLLVNPPPSKTGGSSLLWICAEEGGINFGPVAHQQPHDRGVDGMHVALTLPAELSERRAAMCDTVAATQAPPQGCVAWIRGGFTQFRWG
jgi:hypothetical protein